MNRSELLIIGAGPGGMDTAIAAAEMGLDVTLIEKGEIGGTCLNRGCIPTKAIVASAHAALRAREAGAYGVVCGEVAVDYAAVSSRVGEVVTRLREGAESLLKKVNVVRGEARMAATGPSVWVGEEQYFADRLIIATGSRAAYLPIPGAELADTSDELLKWTELPESLVIIGGGVIGIEFASALAALGVNVTVLEYCKEILPAFDVEVAKRLRTLLSRRGIKLIVSAEATSICRKGELLQLNYHSKGKDNTVECSKVLMAVGRVPVLPQGTAEAGIKFNRKGIMVNDDFRTSAEHIYAIGDVNGRSMLAHVATAQGRKVLGLGVNLRVIPSAVFSIPEVGMAGLTEEQCAERELSYRVGKALFASNGKAVASGETDGFVKVIAGRDGGEILGVHIIGAHAADLVHEISTAMAGAITAREVANAIHAHPTLSEAVASACRAASRAPV